MVDAVWKERLYFLVSAVDGLRFADMMVPDDGGGLGVSEQCVSDVLVTMR